MKSGIHPNWHTDTKVTCSCGNSFVTGSVEPTIELDICDKCHPFFTGELKFVDRQGRVERFMAKVKQAENKPTKKKPKVIDVQSKETKSYRELLLERQTALKKAKKADQADKSQTSSAQNSAQNSADKKSTPASIKTTADQAKE